MRTNADKGGCREGLVMPEVYDGRKQRCLTRQKRYEPSLLRVATARSCVRPRHGKPPVKGGVSVQRLVSECNIGAGEGGGAVGCDCTPANPRRL